MVWDSFGLCESVPFFVVNALLLSRLVLLSVLGGTRCFKLFLVGFVSFFNDGIDGISVARLQKKKMRCTQRHLLK